MNVFWVHMTAVQMQIVLTLCRATHVSVGLGLLGMEGHVQVCLTYWSSCIRVRAYVYVCCRVGRYSG